MKKEFIKTEHITLDGHVLTEDEEARENKIDKDRYWLDRHEKL